VELVGRRSLLNFCGTDNNDGDCAIAKKCEDGDDDVVISVVSATTSSIVVCDLILQFRRE
jgi:hypothetical protein